MIRTPRFGVLLLLCKGYSQRILTPNKQGEIVLILQAIESKLRPRQVFCKLCFKVEQARFQIDIAAIKLDNMVCHSF